MAACVEPDAPPPPALVNGGIPKCSSKDDTWPAAVVDDGFPTGEPKTKAALVPPAPAVGAVCGGSFTTGLREVEDMKSSNVEDTAAGLEGAPPTLRPTAAPMDANAGITVEATRLAPTVAADEEPSFASFAASNVLLDMDAARATEGLPIVEAERDAPDIEGSKPIKYRSSLTLGGFTNRSTGISSTPSEKNVKLHVANCTSGRCEL